MRTLLICPAPRPALAALAERMPLSNLPVFGKSLVEHWIQHQASLGAKEIWILATDRPDQVRQTIGSGAKWGVRAEVRPERQELTLDQARRKYRNGSPEGWLGGPNDVVFMDHLPRQPECKLLSSYSNWFRALAAWMPLAAGSDRIGLQQPRPGVWIGLRARVSSTAQLRPPCWLGEDVSIGPGSLIGPMAILEDRACVEDASEITQSVVGPETYVGPMTQLRHSLAWGETLIDWQTESSLKVPDPFVLSSLAAGNGCRKQVGRAPRLAALFMLALTFPWTLAAILRSKMKGQPALVRRTAVRPRSGTIDRIEELVVYHELESARGWLRRWPQLWNVARGDFAWVGNRPLSPAQARELATEFERLWLAAPIGLFSLADAMGCADCLDDQARAHASFYAVQANLRLDWSIIRRALLAPASPAHEANGELADAGQTARQPIDGASSPRRLGGRMPPATDGWAPASKSQSNAQGREAPSPLVSSSLVEAKK
ncbi:MAG: sugar transferase [Verrucomicrobia bacterium]|nr:sugar transferase [Verrucomicrobiota bacterium]